MIEIFSDRHERCQQGRGWRSQVQNGEGAATWAIFLDLDSREAAAGIKGTEVTWKWQESGHRAEAEGPRAPVQRVCSGPSPAGKKGRERVGGTEDGSVLQGPVGTETDPPGDGAWLPQL